MIWKNQNGLNLIIFEDLDNRVLFLRIIYIFIVVQNMINKIKIALFGLFYPNQNLTNKFKV